MTTRTRDTRTALDAYMAHHAAALALVERIHEAIANHDISPDPEGITWGHVEDIAATRTALLELSDLLFGEGEYAKVACIRCGQVFPSADMPAFDAHRFACR